jgi:hypothetical protein
MNVVGHNHKHKQFHLLGSPQVMKTVNNNPLDDIAAKKMSTPYCVCRDKIEIIGVKVWFNRHSVSFELSQGL